MRRLLNGSGLWALMPLALLCGLLLLAVSEWTRPLAEGVRALDEGRLEQALERFMAAEARFDRLPAARQVLPDAYSASVSNQLWTLYRLGDLDAVIEKAAVSPPDAAVHFWAGCALFARGAEEAEAEARLGWLGRASEEFRAALELNPADWDTKYNYELTERLLAELREQPETPPNELLQLLRPKPQAGDRPSRRVG